MPDPKADAAGMSDPALARRRRIALIAQALAGTLNGLALVFDLASGRYLYAAISLLCIAVVADWRIPGERPGRRSWVLAVAWFVVGIFRARQVHADNLKLLSLLDRMNVLLDGALHAHMTMRAEAAGLAAWWEMTEAQQAQDGAPAQDDAVVLQVIGACPGTGVTAGELRALLAAIYGTQTQEDSDG